MPNFFRRFLTAKTARNALIAFLVLFAALVLYLNVERSRGLQAWTDYQATAKASGVWVDFANFTQSPVPDDQNFAAAPLFKTLSLSGNGADAAPARDFLKRFDALIPADHVPNGLGDYAHWETAEPVDLKFWRDRWKSADLLAPLQQFDPELSAFADAARRPAALFPLEGEPATIDLGPLLDNLTHLACVLELRALAELDQNLPGPAVDDTTTLLRAAQHYASAPGMTYQMFAVDLQAAALPILWQGLADRRWSDSQLAALDHELAALDLLAATRRAWQFEAAFSTAAFEQVLGGPKVIPDDNGILTGLTDVASRFPRGWLYQTMVGFRRYYDGAILASYDLPHHRIDPAAVANVTKMESDIAASWSPYNYLLKSLAPAHQTLMLVARAQNGLDLARVALALERARLATGKFPEKLAALAPTYLATIPPDIITGLPLIYKPSADGDQFVLYSIGWNNQDDGGTPSANLNDRWTTGDWVWAYTPQTKK